jgi:hypothetical protein
MASRVRRWIGIESDENASTTKQSVLVCDVGDGETPVAENELDISVRIREIREMLLGDPHDARIDLMEDDLLSNSTVRSDRPCTEADHSDIAPVPKVSAMSPKGPLRA